MLASFVRRFVVPALALAAASLPADALRAQSRATSAIRGTVVTEAGDPVSFATVTVRHAETGATRRTASTPEGRFLVQLLQPGGPYTVTVEALGFAEAVREGLQLQVGEVVSVEVAVREEALEIEGIEVRADRGEIFTPDQVGPATRLDEATVEAMPILSRDIMELAVLSPLVKTTEGGGFSIAGQNDRYNSILIDGVLNKDLFGQTAGGVPGAQAGAKLIPLDAVAQYEVLVAPFDVRLSGFTGGVMNAITKTGTNDWHLRALGVHRAEALIGDLNLPTGPVEASGVDRSLVGLSVGGPLIRDRSHFFVAGEFEERNQPPSGFNLGRDDPLLVRVGEETLGEMGSLLRGLGVETGRADAYPLSTDLANVFARLDWNFAGGSRLIVRNIFARARNDESPNRAGFEPYELSSNAVFREALSNSTSLQLFSPFGDRVANEFEFTVRLGSDATTPAVAWPQVEIDLVSSIDGSGYQRPVRVGSQFFAQENDLEQASVGFTNSLNLMQGDGGALTLGLAGSYHDIRHRYLPGAAGDYFFASLQDLRNNAPQRYQRTVLQPGFDRTVGIRVSEWGLFAQREVRAGKGLTMHFGLRADVPFVLDSPMENPEILAEFGHRTSNVPSGQILLSPRWGFNWQSEGERTTQVRGGAGLFVGQLPYVWLSNAFHNDGLRSETVVCTGRVTDDPLTGNTVPPMDPLGPPIDTCVAGDFQHLRTVTVFDDGFKYPQDLKFSATVDQRLSDRISGSFGVLYNRAINQIALEELNLDGASSLGPLKGYGGFERRYFGRAAPRGFTPNRELEGYEQVLLARNETEDWAFAVTAELRGDLTEHLAFQTGYSFSKSFDRMSLVSSDMISNYGFNPTRFDPNRPQVTTSNFDRPHKIVFSIYGAPFPGFDDTQVSLLYTGQSGLPYSYVYRGDLNGDGYPGLGPAFDRTNDLVFVPDPVTDLPAGTATYQLLGSAIANEACLAEARGEILARNACRAPWQNRLDLRLSHTVEAFGAQLRFEGDVINVLNLLNGEWGTIESIRPVVSLLEPLGRLETRGIGPLQSGWAGAVLPFRDDDGSLRASEPWSTLTPDSQWQAQFGVRVTLGAARDRR